jgi:hypothetical protein
MASHGHVETAMATWRFREISSAYGDVNSNKIWGGRSEKKKKVVWFDQTKGVSFFRDLSIKDRFFKHGFTCFQHAIEVGN